MNWRNKREKLCRDWVRNPNKWTKSRQFIISILFFESCSTIRKPLSDFSFYECYSRTGQMLWKIIFTEFTDTKFSNSQCWKPLSEVRVGGENTHSLNQPFCRVHFWKNVFVLEKDNKLNLWTKLIFQN